MSTLSVPLTSKIEKMLDDLVARGVAENKAAFARRAILKLAEDEFIDEILAASREVRAGKYFTGDIDEAVKKITKRGL